MSSSIEEEFLEEEKLNSKEAKYLPDHVLKNQEEDLSEAGNQDDEQVYVSGDDS